MAAVQTQSHLIHMKKYHHFYRDFKNSYRVEFENVTTIIVRDNLAPHTELADLTL
jgi:hypothetical protein